MTFQIAGHQTEKYQISTTVYQGPLDLLLELIERAELDITTLALAQVTDQFLAYLRTLDNRDPAEVSAFLVIATRLLQIKSSALLPRPSVIESISDEEDPGEALARQLILYRRFKQISKFFSDREQAGMHTYLRVAPPPFKVEARLDLSELTLNDLVLVARQVLSNRPLTNLSKVVALSRVTIREKISSIITALKNNPFTSFRKILSSKNRTEIVVTFLAMLELIKRHVVLAEQTNLFGDIIMRAAGELEEKMEADSEFGE